MTRFPVVLALCLAAVVAASAPGLHARASVRELTPRLRGVDSDTRELIRLGIELSPTLRRLAARLERTDVVVYVKAARLPLRMDGQLTFLSAAAGLRYVIVEIAWDRPDTRRFATLGHELQHALEIAERPDIVDADTLAQAYAAFGVRRDAQRTGWQAYDTAAAMDAGDRVWKELTGAVAADD
jgi:hypothetical protein